LNVFNFSVDGSDARVYSCFEHVQYLKGEEIMNTANNIIVTTYLTYLFISVP